MNIFKKLNTYIKKHWLLAILSILVGVLFAFWLTRSQPKPPEVMPQAAPAALSILSIIERSPKSETFEAANSTTPLFLTFSQPINLSTISLISDPIAEFRLEIRPENQSRLVVRPFSPWRAKQTYRIIIKSGVSSVDNKYLLQKDFEMKFTVEEIPRPDYDRPS